MGAGSWTYFLSSFYHLMAPSASGMDLLSALGSGSATGLCGDPVRGVKFGPPETGNTGQLLVISQNWVPDPQIPSSFFHLAICNHEQFEFSVSEFILISVLY